MSRAGTECYRRFIALYISQSPRIPIFHPSTPFNAIVFVSVPQVAVILSFVEEIEPFFLELFGNYIAQVH
jgi:hypothetical protein